MAPTAEFPARLYFYMRPDDDGPDYLDVAPSEAEGGLDGDVEVGLYLLSSVEPEGMGLYAKVAPKALPDQVRVIDHGRVPRPYVTPEPSPTCERFCPVFTGTFMRPVALYTREATGHFRRTVSFEAQGK